MQSTAFPWCTMNTSWVSGENGLIDTNVGKGSSYMSVRTLKKIEALAGKVGHAFLATADGNGAPPTSPWRAPCRWIPAARSASRIGSARARWLIDINRRAAVVVWDGDADEGYQIGGLVEDIEEIAMMDGYSPSEEKLPPMPQVERKPRLRPERVAQFRKAPHSDLED